MLSHGSGMAFVLLDYPAFLLAVAMADCFTLNRHSLRLKLESVGCNQTLEIPFEFAQTVAQRFNQLHEIRRRDLWLGDLFRRRALFLGRCCRHIIASS